jgi:hypothetical protein
MLHRISILWLLAVLALLTFVASAKGDSSPGVLKAEQGAQLEHETPLQFAPALPGADLTASECPPYASAVTPATHGIVYDGGWILRPFVPQQSPFELKVSLQNQFRHTGFANEEAQVVNSTGILFPPLRSTRSTSIAGGSFSPAMSGIRVSSSTPTSTTTPYPKISSRF